MPTRRQCANAIRALAIDAIEKSRSGHPGAPLGMADMAEALWRHGFKHNPANPGWMDRDRFVLSNGHASMLLYAVLHLTGYDLSMDDIRNFRQLGSRTPGHPECDVTPGVEMTTGPLGQGISSAVGMALAEKMLATRFNTPEHTVIDHHTYVFLGDGCLMEGVSHEACSLAGVWGLGKLIALYDSNGISIDGKIDGWFTEDVAARYKAYGWQVIGPVDGHDAEALDAALAEARADAEHPSLIICKTHIGFGSSKADSASCHGSPLGVDVAAAVEKGKSAFAGPELKGKTLAVIGLGAIGRLVANAAVDLGMQVIGYDPFLKDASVLKPGVTVNNDLDQVFPLADYITVHVPLTPDTKELICAESIAKMKDTVRVMNFARGDLANADDVVEALEEGKMAAYVTDFPSAKLIDVDGVIAIPHLGASTPESEENCASMGAEELIDFLEHGNIQNSVNLPTVRMDPNGAARMTVVHKNQPNMIATITDTISKDGMNIAAFTDKNRGEIAYSIIDTDTAYSAGVVADIEKIDGVIRVRVIQD